MELLKHKTQEYGYLKVILGSMFSGKTTELIKIYNKYKSCEIPCCIINHISDDRYDKEKMSNHNGVMLESFNYKNLIECLSLVGNYDIFLINEGQFFDDLYDIVNLLVNMHKKKVYVCGLDGDYKRRKFGSILDIVPLCDDVVKLKAICKKCKRNQGIFTHRMSKETKQTLIGSDNYMALCRSCYNMYCSTTPPVRRENWNYS
jgi:thymidine kinase